MAAQHEGTGWNRRRAKSSLSGIRCGVEQLEERSLLTLVPWTIDASQSFLSLAVPDQDVVFNGTTANVKIRNQSGGNGGPWNVGNTASISGTIDTDYVDDTSIEFLAGQTNILGVNSGNYRPDPAAYTGGIVNPDGTASGGSFTGSGSAPGVFGARVRATVSIFTVDAGFASFYDVNYDTTSPVLPISGGAFPANTMDAGISHSLLAVDGLTVILIGQPLADGITAIDNVLATNQSPTATIVHTGPLTRRIVIPISLALTIPIDNDPTHVLQATAAGTIVANATISAPSSVVGRQLFYNQSGTGGATVRYDGNDLAINSLDDNAIATDKVALLPGAGPATFANVSSYSKGINGLMVDISGTHPNIGIDDFEFHVGNNNSPSTWALANPPTSVSVRAGAGVSGSDRVEIIWNSGAPLKQWLEVAVLANADTGLAPLGGGYTGARATWGDVFYFGNPVGDTGAGDTSVNATVNAVDEGGTRNNPQVVGNNIPITNIYDVNRNAVVNAVDEGIIRNNNTNSATVLKYLNLADPPAAPQGDGGDGDAGVASALTAAAPATATPSMPRWLGLRLDEIALNSGRVAQVFQGLHDFNTPTARKLLVRADRIVDDLGLDHELLDSLLADLRLE